MSAVLKNTLLCHINVLLSMVILYLWRDLLSMFCTRQFIDCLICSQSSVICNRLYDYRCCELARNPGAHGSNTFDSLVMFKAGFTFAVFRVMNF